MQESGAVAWSLHRDDETLRLLKESNFDLMLRDAVNWPSFFLEEFLEIPSVELLPLPVMMPLMETLSSVPNPIAYVPQLGTALNSSMVGLRCPPLGISIRTALLQLLSLMQSCLLLYCA